MTVISWTGHPTTFSLLVPTFNTFSLNTICIEPPYKYPASLLSRGFQPKYLWLQQMKSFPPGQTRPTICRSQHYSAAQRDKRPLDWQKKKKKLALTTGWVVATLPPKALSRAVLRFGWTRIYNATQDIVGVVRARIISPNSCSGYSSPFLLAYVFVEADAVFSPIVGAVSSNPSKDGGGENEEGKERGKDDFHDAFSVLVLGFVFWWMSFIVKPVEYFSSDD